MQLFINLTTRSKLLFGFGLMILMLATVSVSAWRSIAAIQTSQEVLYVRDFADALDLMTLRSRLNGVRAALLNMMLLPGGPEQVVWHDEIKQRSMDIERLLQQLQARERDDLTYSERLKVLNSVVETYVKTRDTQQIPSILAGRLDEAKALALGIQTERYTQIRALAQELADQAEKRAQAAVAGSRQRAAESRRILIVIGALALVFGMAMALLLTRVIATPLKEITDIAERIAAGDLSSTLVVNLRTDEIGILLRAFSLMLGSLREMASIATQIAAGNLKVQVKPQSEQDTLGNAFAVMVNNLRELTLEMLENINVLTSAASEILATTTQVASGSAETATAVSETTATVEEVKQTVQMASQKARHVSESAQQTAQAVQTGQQALEQMIDGMNRIRIQTAATADSIVRLSEQSNAIGEIIASVNDFAEQSNLLAVNAAIEAAKAGEQGKGFTVVAQEIKSLAQQSKQATAQVRAILSDIQKATAAAVMATDLNGKAVEAGVQQSETADNAIQLLADNISAAAQAALQIAASSQQQMVGMDQVALAMENIKQASSQNMSGTRQAEAAAQNLHELGVKLKQMVERYKV